MAVLIDADIEDLSEIRMPDRHQASDFGGELAGGRLRKSVPAEPLDDDIGLQPGMPGTVHVRLAPRAESSEDRVLTNLVGECLPEERL